MVNAQRDWLQNDLNPSLSQQDGKGLDFDQQESRSARPRLSHILAFATAQCQAAAFSSCLAGGKRE